MDRPRYLAVVQFVHARGCTLGSPYGGCADDCGYRVVKRLGDGPLTQLEQVAYGVQPEEMRW